MRTRKINIQGKEYEFGYGLKSLFLFEQIQGKRFDLRTISDTYVFYFCCFLAMDENFMDADFNRFIQVCEDEPQLAKAMAKALNELTKEESNLDSREADSTTDDKKKD